MYAYFYVYSNAKVLKITLLIPIFQNYLIKTLISLLMNA